jgi:ABC-type bacteriocin/lantibiotic exporter with double-glycine peptidase domain
MEVAECGAACLVMVLGAHGREIVLEEARERCGTSRDGVDAAALARAAVSYGLEVKALRREPETLADLPLPAILHWSFNHFVVLVSVSGRHFTILDPATGRRTVDAAEMGRCFTGLALAMHPGETFTRGGERSSVASALLAHLRGS